MSDFLLQKPAATAEQQHNEIASSFSLTAVITEQKTCAAS